MHSKVGVRVSALKAPSQRSGFLRCRWAAVASLCGEVGASGGRAQPLRRCSSKPAWRGIVALLPGAAALRPAGRSASRVCDNAPARQGWPRVAACCGAGLYESWRDGRARALPLAMALTLFGACSLYLSAGVI